jgi:CheY-like chemotaxis protein
VNTYWRALGDHGGRGDGIPSTPESSQEEKILGRELSPPVLQGYRVLLVEDHDDTREVFTSILKTSGALVLDASTAIDALPLVAMCDVVVTDLAMSGRDGLWLLQQVEAGMHRVPVIAMTAYSEDFELEGAPQFASVIRKPVEPAELVGRILAVLRGHSRD